MLFRLGERRSSSSELVDLLLACHERIRRFTDLAIRLATTAAPEAETRDAAGQIRRYFVEAFPLHVADEDEELVPRLAGSSEELDRALEQVTAEHASHAPAVATLVALCGELVAQPARLAARASDLAGAGAELRAALEPHLALEERLVFPAVRRLTTADQGAIHLAMRARRERALQG